MFNTNTEEKTIQSATGRRRWKNGGTAAAAFSWKNIEFAPDPARLAVNQRAFKGIIAPAFSATRHSGLSTRPSWFWKA